MMDSLEFKDRDRGEGDGLLTGLVAWGQRQGGAHMGGPSTRSRGWDCGTGTCYIYQQQLWRWPEA